MIFTDHEPLIKLLNTPHPSGKLATWELILQDMDLKTKYKPGRKNNNADAVSRFPKDLPTMQDVFAELSGMVTTLDLNDEVESKDGESTLHNQQMVNSEKDCLLHL